MLLLLMLNRGKVTFKYVADLSFASVALTKNS